VAARRCVGWYGALRQSVGASAYYTTASIVNASDYSPGPFAPSSVLSLFGTNLAWTTEAVTPETLAAGSLPTQLAATIVFVDNVPVPLLYASPTQINFLVPAEQIPGDVTVTVVRQGVSGPAVTIALIDAPRAVRDGRQLRHRARLEHQLHADDARRSGACRRYRRAVCHRAGYTNPPWASGVVAQSAAYITARPACNCC